MMTVSLSAYSVLCFTLHWESARARHEECCLGWKVNHWRDILPPELDGKLTGARPGDRFSCILTPGGSMPVAEERLRRNVERRHVQARMVNGRIVEPRFGRFYPQGMLSGLPGILPANMTPFRVTGVRREELEVDLNHPLAGRCPRLEVEVQDVWPKESDLGGSCTHWMETLLDGPGIQAGWQDRPTDFFEEGALTRADENDDTIFYARPRLTAHVDSQARENITRISSRLLKPGMRVLDLMSGCCSHLPAETSFDRVAGLGMNAEEMAANPRLDDHIVHDLNREPALPFADGAFDAVLCALSVEYLTRPFEVMRHIHRVLAPGGLVLFTFSNRWFPGKVVRVWTELHEFERTGLVSEYLLRDALFSDLHTLSMRGWPRPHDERDRYFPLLQLSDPVHAVWAVRA